MRKILLIAGIILLFLIGGESLQYIQPGFVKAADHKITPKVSENKQIVSSTNSDLHEENSVNTPKASVNRSDQEGIERKTGNIPSKKKSVSLVKTRVSGNFMTTSNLNVRSGASLEYPIIGTLEQGAALSIEWKLSNGWYQINFSGKTGYVSGEYVEKQQTTAIFKMNVPVVLQNPELPTGCEVTSLTMALNYKGVKVDKITLARKMPYTTTLDPNQGFVGSPFKPSGETINPVKLQELAKAYRSRSSDLTGASIATIEKEVRAGNPVLVWYTIGYVEPTDDYLYRNGHKYWFPQPMHCIVVTGASLTSFLINDPLNGNKNYSIDKNHFNKIYTKMGKRALVVR